MRVVFIGTMAVLLLGGCGSSRMIDSAAAPGATESPNAAAAHDAAGIPQADPSDPAPSSDSDADLAQAPPAADDGAQLASSPVDFETQIRPILERCQPCHFEGGKMYAQLPFDRPETVRTLGEKLFTRINEPAEQATIRAFLAQPEDAGASRQ